MSGSVASYRLEAGAIAVNTQRTNFLLLTQKELEGCSKASISFCSIQEPGVPSQFEPFFVLCPFPCWLQAVEQIPLRKLITELADQDDLVEDTTSSYPAWLYVVVGTLVLVMILTALIYKCKGRCLRGSVRWRGDERDSGAAAKAPGIQMVPVITTRGGDDTERDGTLRTTAAPRRGASGGQRPTRGRTQTATFRENFQGWGWFQPFSTPA